MKNLFPLICFVLSFVIFNSCSTELSDSKLNAPLKELTSIEDVIDLELDKKFSIPKEIYEEFINSITFKDNRFAGCYYEAIDSLFDTPTSNKFWNNFNIHIRENNKRLDLDLDHDGHYLDKKNYWLGGCKPKEGWVCAI